MSPRELAEQILKHVGAAPDDVTGDDLVSLVECLVKEAFKEAYEECAQIAENIYRGFVQRDLTRIETALPKEIAAKIREMDSTECFPPGQAEERNA